MVARRHSDDSASNPCRELAYFLTTGIVISAFALPIVLSRAPVAVTPPPPTETDSSAIITTTLAPNTTTTTTVVSRSVSPASLHNSSFLPFYLQITGGACGFVLTANAIMFLTILGFFITFDGDDVQYSVW